MIKAIGILIVACLLFSGCGPAYVSPYLKGEEQEKVMAWATAYIEPKTLSGWKFEVSDIVIKVDGYYKIFVEMEVIVGEPWDYKIKGCGYLWYDEEGTLMHVSNRSIQ